MNQMIEMAAAPPYFVQDFDLHPITPIFSTHDLISSYKLKYEPEEIVMQLKLEDLANTIAFDTKTITKTQGVYNPAGSKYLFKRKPEQHTPKRN